MNRTVAPVWIAGKASQEEKREMDQERIVKWVSGRSQPELRPETPLANALQRTGLYFTPKSWNRNASTSACSSMRSLRALSTPWPEPNEVRSSTGRPDDVAAWSRAAILRELYGSTRASF